MLLVDIRNIIGDVFGDTSLFFSTATLTRVTGSAGWNESAEWSMPYPCKALVTRYDERQRVTLDIPDTDSKVMIVGTSIATQPVKGDTVTVGGRNWALIRVEVDPAQAMWICQARPN